MTEIARITGGQTFTAADAERLAAVYEQLGSRVGTREEEDEVGWILVAGALGLLAAGMASSMALLGRWV
jgi:Ca-activated chloride channel family protein